MILKLGNETMELPESFDKSDVKVKAIDGIKMPRIFGDRCPFCGGVARWLHARDTMILECGECDRIFDVVEGVSELKEGKSNGR